MGIPFTEQLTQALSIPAASIYPVNVANNATGNVCGPINMRNFRRAMAHVVVGVLTGTANVQAFFQSSATSGGTFANVSGGATIGTVNTANTEYTLEIRADQMPSGQPWLQLVVLVGGNSAYIAAPLYGDASDYAPANQFDANTTVLPSRNVT